MSLSKSASVFPEESIGTNYISVCGICLSAYEVPKGLPCLHSFCLECIRQWTRAPDGEEKNKTRRVTCPNCRKECVLPDNGVDGLPTNFFITERNQEDAIPDCSSCGNHDRDIIARCRDCGFVCNECMLSHKTMRALKEHDVIMMDTLRVGKTIELVGKLKISRRQGNGIFKLEKIINLKHIDSTYNAWCCTILSGSKYKVAVPVHSPSSKVHVLDIDGEHKLTIDTQIGLHPGKTSSPFNTCVNPDGLMYITDCGPWVKVHDAQGRFMRLFQVVNDNGEPCKTGNAKGIVIDNKQQIIVGDLGNKNTVSIYTRDESFVKGFKVTYPPQYLAATLRNTLLVCDAHDGKLMEVDYSGKVLNTITNPINDMGWLPKGMCCSKDGEIFVVNAAPGKGAILRFSDTWRYTGCVVSDLSDPSGISISEDDEILAVIDSHFKLKIFRRS